MVRRVGERGTIVGMRWVVIAVLAGCYSPNTIASCSITCIDACPNGLACVQGRCQAAPGVSTCFDGDGGLLIDGSMTDGDVDIDGSTVTPLCPAPAVLQTDTQLTAGESLHPRVPSESVAILTQMVVDNMGTPRRQISTTLDPGFSTGYQLNFESTDDTDYGVPAMAPAGDEMFMRFHVAATNSTFIVRGLRAPGQAGWSGLFGTNLPVDPAGYDPSAPSSTNPRRMILSKASNYVEVEETDNTNPTTWELVTDTNPDFVDPANANVKFLGQAHLTAEGRRLVFKGQIDSNIIRAFYVERDSITMPFASPARPLPNSASLSVSFPVLTSDCKQLFYAASNGTTHRVSY